MEVDGVVLKALPYGEKDAILTLFSEQGLIRCYVKQPKRPQPFHLALISPFTRGQYVLTPRKNMLHLFQDGTIIEQHLALRDHWERLEMATDITRAILATQWPDKPTPILYALFVKFLYRIHTTTQHLHITFLIKLLKHEGVLETERRKEFNEQEHQLLLHIAHARSWEDIPSSSEAFAKKVQALCEKILAR